MEAIIIDTGIDSNENQDCLAGGINLITLDKNYEDDNGHGSLCSSIIRTYSETLPRLYSIKILNENNESSLKLLVEALEYSRKLDIRLINLSLSTLKKDNIEVLKKTISELYDIGKIIVASIPNSGQLGYPASLRYVIGVNGVILKNQKEYWYNQDYSVQCVANRIPVMVKGYKGKYNMFGGTSKATALMTAIIGNILEKNPDISYENLQTILVNSATRCVWTQEEVENLSRYFVEEVNIIDDKEREIECLVLDYLHNKGFMVIQSDLNKYGYQRFLIGEDFYEIIKRIEILLGIKIPHYSGFDYRIFENAKSLKNFFD